MKFHLPIRNHYGFRTTDQPSELYDIKKVKLGRVQILSDRISVRPGTRYRLSFRAEIDSHRPDAALVVFNTDQPVLPEEASRYFPRYTAPVGAPFSFIGKPGKDGLTKISFTAPPNVSEIILGLRRWAAGGTVRVASVLVVEAEGEAPKCQLVDDPDALQSASYIVLSRAETSFGDVAVEAGRKYVVSAMVENDTGRGDAALLTFTPDTAISLEEARQAFPRFTPAVGKPFSFIDAAGGARIVSTSFIAPAGARRVSIAARRWANGGTVRIGNRILAVDATADDGRQRSILLPLPSRAIELLITPAASPFLAQSGRFDAVVGFLDSSGGTIPYSRDRADYRFSRMVLRSPFAMTGNDPLLCVPEFVYAPPGAVKMQAKVSGSDAHLLPSADIVLRDILPTLADEPGALNRRLTHREATLHAFLAGREALPAALQQALADEANEALLSLRAVRSMLAAAETEAQAKAMAQHGSNRAQAAAQADVSRESGKDAATQSKSAGEDIDRAPVVAAGRERERWSPSQATTLKSSRRRDDQMRMLFVSPRRYGMLGTAATYHLIEAYARHIKVRVVADAARDTPVPVVHAPPPDLDLREVVFGTPGYTQQIATIAKEYNPDIVCLGSYRNWPEVIQSLRRAAPSAKFVYDIKSPLVTDEGSRRRLHQMGLEQAHLLDLIVSSQYIEDVQSWLPDANLPVQLYPLGIKVEQFSPRRRSETTIRCHRFVFIGSLVKQRRIDKILEYMNELPGEIRKNITLDLFGSGPAANELKELIQKIGLERVVHIKDSLPQDRLFELLPTYDAGLAWVPREIYDAAPSLKLLEYLGSGLVVIASSTTGHHRIFQDGFRGVIFDESPESFTEAITKVHVAGVPQAHLQLNLQTIKKRDWDNIATEILLPALNRLLAPPAAAMPQQAAVTAAQGPVAAAALLPGDPAAPIKRDAAAAYSRMLVWSPDLPMQPDVVKPQSRLRIACILSDRLFEGLTYEAELLLLTEASWKQTLRFGRVDMLLIESAWSTCTGDWYMAQLPGGEERDRLDSLLKLAKSLAIPTVFWMTQGHEYLHLYQDFATRFDQVFCADPHALAGLAKLGVRAMLLPPAIQPRRFNPIKTADESKWEKPGIVYDGWSDLYKFPEIRTVLERLPTEALSIIDTSAMLAHPQIARIPEPALRRALKGWVHRSLLPEIYKRADAYLSFSQSTLPPTQASWALVEAAGCRMPPIHLGALDADDFRTNFVRRWGTPREFLDDIGEVMADSQAHELAAHRAWREAHGRHTFADRLALICRELGLRYEWEPFPRATLVTGTMRPHLLEKSVQQYLDQTYPNKELVVVFNGRLQELAAVQDKYRQRADIVFTALPTDRRAGSLLNFGVRQGTGRYFFRVDDDDHYGVNYIYDCMLHLRASDADVFGKHASFFHFEGEESVYKRTDAPPQIMQFAAKDIDLNVTRGLFFSGCGFACKSDLLKTITYPDENNLSADTELLTRIKAARPDAICLKVDSLNLVVERSADVEQHTWRQPAARLKRVSELLDKRIADLMV